MSATVNLRSGEQCLLMLQKLLYFHFKRKSEVGTKNLRHKTQEGMYNTQKPTYKSTHLFHEWEVLSRDTTAVKFNQSSTWGKRGNKRKSKEWQGYWWQRSILGLLRVISKNMSASLTALTFAIQQCKTRCTYPTCTRTLLLYFTFPECSLSDSSCFEEIFDLVKETSQKIVSLVLGLEIYVDMHRSSWPQWKSLDLYCCCWARIYSSPSRHETRTVPW